MARTVTLSGLRTRCKERADMENTNFISAAEWYRMISASYTELYDLLVLAQPDFYRREGTAWSGDGTTKDFAVASDFYGMLAVYQDLGGGNRKELTKISGAEIGRYNHTTAGTATAWHPVYNSTTPSTYKIRLLPTPASGQSYIHVYTVAPADLSADADVIDGVSGWEEYIVLDVAIKALTKEESPTGALEAQRARMLQRIEDMIENRTAGEAGHVIDIYDEALLEDPSSRYRTPA